MTKEQLLLSLAVIICSGVTSAIVTYKLNANNNERYFLRQKLEELNLAIIRYCSQLDAHFLPYISVMAGKITYNQALDLELNKANAENFLELIFFVF